MDTNNSSYPILLTDLLLLKGYCLNPVTQMQRDHIIQADKRVMFLLQYIKTASMGIAYMVSDP